MRPTKVTNFMVGRSQVGSLRPSSYGTRVFAGGPGRTRTAWASKIGTTQRIFVVDFGEEKSCNLHIAQKPLIKGVLSAISDTDVSGNSKKSRNGPTGDQQSYPEMKAMSDNRADLDPSSWDPALDAVIAAPKHHKVLFENDRLRVLEVTLEPNDEEPIHHHRWPSVFVFDQVQGPVHDFAPDGTQLPPNRDVVKAIEAWEGQGCLVVNMAPQPPDGSSTPRGGPSTASESR